MEEVRNRTLSMSEEGPEGFCGGHEIFFKIFDGPRNIFLCSIFIILFFKLKGFQRKISKLAIKEI